MVSRVKLGNVLEVWYKAAGVKLMKFFKQEALLVIFLLGLNSCVQEPNRQSSEPDTEPYTSPVLPSPSLIKKISVFDEITYEIPSKIGKKVKK